MYNMVQSVSFSWSVIAIIEMNADTCESLDFLAILSCVDMF